MKTLETTTINRRKEAMAERLKAEDQIRAPLIQQITDALPVFRQDDFESWPTNRILNLVDRVKVYEARARVDDAYVKKVE